MKINKVWRGFCAILLAGTLLAGTLHAGITVTNVITHSRSSEGLIDIDFEVLSDNPDAEIWVLPVGRDGNQNSLVTPKTLTGDGVNMPLKQGQYRMTWDVALDKPDYFCSDFTLSLYAAPGRYMVVDLSENAGSGGNYMIRHSNVAPEINNDSCRTTNLWLRLIPPGSFMMGSPLTELGRSNNEDYHQVTLTEPFYIGIFETTRKHYGIVMGESVYNDVCPIDTISYSTIRGWGHGGSWPLNNNVDDASFLGRLRAQTSMIFDLPTEAQWEYACRAGTSTALNNGKNLTSLNDCVNVAEVARYRDNLNDGKGGYYNSPTKVGSYLPNAWGLYDMHGNVWEWCLDWYVESLGTTAVIDPIGETSGMGRVGRGGGWLYDGTASESRSAFRYWGLDPGGNYYAGGFRVAAQAAICKADALSMQVNVPISGTLSGQQNWKSGRTYLISSDIVVPSGATLTIPMGCSVKFAEGASLIVQRGGTLRVTGTKFAPVVFTSMKDDNYGGDSNGDGNGSYPAMGDWGMVKLDGGYGEFAYCSFLFAGGVDGNQHGARANVMMWNNASGSFKACRFVESTMDGCFAQNSTFENCIFEGNDRGLVSHTGNVVANNCIFYQNGIGFFKHGGTLTVKNSISAFNFEYGVDSDAGSLTARYNCFYNPDGANFNRGGVSAAGNIVADPLFVDAANGDFRVVSGSPCVDAGDGSVAPMADYYGQPRQNILASDAITGVANEDGMYPDIGIYEEIPRHATSDVDMTALLVKVPESARVGDRIEVLWTIGNEGVADATGSWRDAVYLVSQSGTSVEMGTVVVNGLVPCGGTKEISYSFTVPAVSDGMWSVKVVVNSQRDIWEGGLTENNAAFSSDTINIQSATMSLSQLAQFTVMGQGSAGFKVDSAGMTGGCFVFSASSPIQVYGASGRMPNSGAYDWKAVEIESGVWALILPENVDTTSLYLYVQNNGGQPVTVTTDILQGFALYQNAPLKAPNIGSVTLQILGSGLKQDAEVWLSKGGQSVAATKVALTASGLFATFPVVGLSSGIYQANVRIGDSTQCLSDALELFDGTQDLELVTSLEMPSAIRSGRVFTGIFKYENPHDFAIPAPYVKFTANAGTSIAFSSDDIYNDTLEFMAISETYPVSLLKPGEKGQVSFSFKSEGSATIKYTYTFANPEPFPWEGNAPYMRPSWANDELWGLVLSTLKQRIGQTWDDYLTVMRGNLDYLASIGSATHRMDKIWQMEVNQALGVDNAISTLSSGTDLHRLGRGVNLTFARTYRSGLYQRMKKGRLGWGWSDNALGTYESLENGNVLKFTLPSGQMHSFTRVVVQSGASIYSSIPYAPSQAKTSSVSSLGLITQWPEMTVEWVPNVRGDKTKLTESGTAYVLTYLNKTVYRFDRRTMLITSITDVNGNAVSFTYGANNQLTRMAHTDGQTLEFSYSGELLTEASDDHGRTVRYTYTGDLLTKVTLFNGLEMQYRYLPADTTPCSRALNQIIYPDGTTRDYLYDLSGRIVATSRNGTLQTVEIVRGDLGSYSIVDANGAVSTIQTGASGEVLKMENALGQMTELGYYPESGLLKSITSPGGSRVSLQYDVSYMPVLGINELGNEIKVGYTGHGNVQAITDALGQKLIYTYDMYGRPIGIIYPNGTKESITYTEKGDIKTLTNRRGQTIQFIYDEEGRMVTKTWPNGQFFTWIYDTRGNPIKITSSTIIPGSFVIPSASITMTYDEFDRLTQIMYFDRYWFDYTYDAVGRIRERSDQSGHKIKYSYDPLGRLSEVKDKGDNLYLRNIYDEKTGLLDGQLYGNGASIRYGYDILQRIKSITHKDKNDTVIDVFGYSYDVDGRRVSHTMNSGVEQYGYDLTGQLTDVTYSDAGKETFTYDAVGNRLRTVKDGVSTMYSVNEMNQYTQVGDVSLSYDADGNLIAKTKGDATTLYEYDVENRLIKVVRPDGTVWVCDYDALGNRVVVIDDGAVVLRIFTQGRLPSVAAEYTNENVLTKRYIHAGDVLIADESIDGFQRYYHPDGMASMRVLTGNNGSLIGRANYNAFGEIQSSVGETSIWGFVGMLGVENDLTGLLFMRNRYYDATIGRFIQMDPIGLNAGDENQYRYCFNNPISRMDVDGKQSSFCSPTQQPGADNTAPPPPGSNSRSPAEDAFDNGLRDMQNLQKYKHENAKAAYKWLSFGGQNLLDWFKQRKEIEKVNNNGRETGVVTW